MFDFRDAAGREWSLKLNLGIANRLRDAKVIDLLRITENKMARFRELMTNPYDLVGVVWEIVRPQAETCNVTFDEFMRGLDGDAIDAMMDAFSRALADFFPALRELILKGLEKGKQTKAMASEQALDAISKIDPSRLIAPGLAAAEAEIATMMASHGTGSPGSAARDSDTTPKAG